jgi:hypothetical protein
MKLRRLALAGALFCASLAVLAIPVVSFAATPSVPYNVLSNSYYHVDPVAGTMTVRVEATFYNNQGSDLNALPLWAMPGAKDVSVTAAGTGLSTKLIDAVGDLPAVVSATLAQPLKSGKQLDVVMSYTVVAQKNALVNLSAGSMEAMFVSQGKGSFVLIDVPAAAETYFDPGCVPTAEQPANVTGSGYKRWVCGEVLRAVFNRSNETESACAKLEDRCRQNSSLSPISAYGQSVTDTAARGLLETDIPLSEKSVHVTFQYFKQNQAWADAVFATAKKSLPLLEKLFGSPYPNDSLSIRQSSFIEEGGALGISYNTGGDVLITPAGGGLDAEVIVHELGHQWAGANLSSPWEAEGLAEYAMRTLAPQLGFTPSNRHWDSLGYTDNLALWGTSPIASADYWYGKAGAFFFAYEKAIGGPANMTKVLAQTNPHSDSAPFDARWFMDAGEDVSGANLDSLFMQWVFNPQTAGPAVAERRTARDLVKTLTTRAATMGLTGTPKDIATNLDAWMFSATAGQVTDGNAVLDDYASVLKLASDNSYGPSVGVAKSWGTATLAQTKNVIEDQRQALQQLVDAGKRLSAEAGGSPAMLQLADAHGKYDAGDFDEAKHLAATSTTTAFNEIAAAKMLTIARNERASYRPTFLGRIGLLFANPDGDLAKAEKAYSSGDPTSALTLARSAYDGWNGASSRGLSRLGILAAVMCGLSVGVWWLLRRIDRPAAASRATSAQGHVLDSPESRRGSWKDWENTQ